VGRKFLQGDEAWSMSQTSGINQGTPECWLGRGRHGCGQGTSTVSSEEGTKECSCRYHTCTVVRRPRSKAYGLKQPNCHPTPCQQCKPTTMQSPQNSIEGQTYVFSTPKSTKTRNLTYPMQAVQAYDYAKPATPYRGTEVRIFHPETQIKK